jgi:anaerobic ribonucleoside-triphosphate reductase activating protein
MNSSLHIYRPDPGTVRVSQIVESSRSEGPDARFCVWLQGCELHCPGCCNPEMFDFDSPAASDVPVASLVDQLRQARGTEGITLLGGEPFHQAPAAGTLAAAAQSLGLGVVTFTGYELDVLSAAPAAADLLAHTDLLIAGPFVAAARSIARPWVGSDNQQLHFLSPRYRHHPDLSVRGQSVHVQLLDGDLRVTGWPGAVSGVRIRPPVRPKG